MNKFLAFLLISLVIFAKVNAEDGEHEEDDNDSNDRDMNYQYDASQVEVRSEDPVLGNEISFRMKTGEDDGLRFELEFKTLSSDEDSDDSSSEDGASSGDDDKRYSSFGGFKSLFKRDDDSDETSLKVEGVLIDLITYQDDDENGAYTEGEETAVYNLGDMEWSPIECTGVDTYLRCDVYSDYMGVSIYLTPTVTDVGSNVTLKPTVAKLDVVFYKETTDYLALVAGFKIDTEDDDSVEFEDESDEEREGVATSEQQVSLGSNAFFSWSETASFSGGSTIDVVAGDVTQDSGYDVIVFSFETSAEGDLIWDPKMAVKGTTTLTTGSAGIMIPSVALLLAILAALFIVYYYCPEGFSVKCRASDPSMHRLRVDIMKKTTAETPKVAFGQYMVHHSQVFWRSEWSLGLVNLMPVKPGHVLVIPKRKVHRFKDLIPQEVADVFLSAQKISTFLETYHKSSAATLALQDGTDAGQTVFHCHVHIIPRHPNDFKRNDDVYSEIEKPREKRTEDDMANEAQAYAKHFPEIENFDFILTAEQEKLVESITNKHNSDSATNT